MRVLVCGSRDFADGQLLLDVLDALDHRREFTCLIHGAADGADSLAAFWAEKRGFPDEAILAFPADWDVHEDTPPKAIRTARGRQYNAWAGNIRNQRMLDEGKPELVVAFANKPLQRSRGTGDMVMRSRKERVKTIVVESW